MASANRDGRPSRRVTEQFDWFTWQGITSEKEFTQDFVWNDLGEPAEIRYPQCSPVIYYADGTSRTCPASPRTISLPDHIANPSAPAYRNGAMVSVPGYGSFLYHPNMMMRQVSHSNGVIDYIENDPYSMRRPYRIYTTGAITNSWGDGNYYSGYFEYDGAGNIRKMDRDGAGSTDQDTFTYDVVGRLTQGNLSAGNTQQTLSYDAYGNIQSMTVGGDTRTQTTSAATNRLTVGGASYDDAGNLTQYGAYTFYYDSFNMMTGMVSSNLNYAYAYTADDERLRVYNNLGWTKWRIRDANNKILREYAETEPWHVSADFVHRQDGLPLAQIGYFTNHFSLDHLGSTRRWTDSARVASMYSYYPFGEFAPPLDGTRTPLHFTGHERDEPSGGDINKIDYMHARSYFSIVGRFLSVDPIDGDIAEPQSWNRYSYVLNNPMTHTDPFGLVPCTITGSDGKPHPGECIQVEGADPLGQARSAAQRDSAFRDAELFHYLREASQERAGGYTPFMRAFNSSSWNDVWSKLGSFIYDNPEEVAYAAVPLFRITGLKYVKAGARVLRGNVTQRGGVTAAREQFARLTGRAPRGATDQVKLPDGTVVKFRESGSGGAKVEINDAANGTYQKTTFVD